MDNAVDNGETLMVTVKGHRLFEQGAAYGKPGCNEVVCVAFGKARLTGTARQEGGHALCECGAQSEHLPSSRERRAWHRSHKHRVLESMVPPEMRRESAS